MTLSQRDLSRLEGLHVDLVRVVRRAAELMPDDLGFTITEGVRTKERQAQLVAAGASQTMNSRHLTGHAVDLAAVLDGQVRWDWGLYYRLADIVADAVRELAVPMVWGGCFDRPILQWKSRAYVESDDYAARRRAVGARPFLDGPHWELDRKAYP